MWRALRSRFGIATELISFIWQRKWWWLAPLVVLLLLFSALLVLTHASALAPFIYTLF
jgi:hypothetical protein